MMGWLRWLLNLPPGASTFADGLDTLHFVVIATTLLVAVGIAGLTTFYLLRFRRKTPDQPTHQVKGSLLGEVFIIGSVLTVFVGFWAIGFAQYIRLETPPDGALVIHVTAKQWVWKFSYPNGRRALNVLTVPVGQPVKLLMTSRDVIHSFYVPAFRIKQDVIPGRYVTAWFQATLPGHYDLYCAEYCGVSHSRMLGSVTVLEPAAYEAWLAQDGDDPLPDEDFLMAGGTGGATNASLVEHGRALAVQHQCFACHTIDGQRHIGPTWKGLFGATVPLESGQSVVADETYLTRSMMDPLADVHAGFKPLMPPYQGVLPSPEAAAIVEYIKSLRDSDAQPTVQLPALEEAGARDAGPNRETP